MGHDEAPGGVNHCGSGQNPPVTPFNFRNCRLDPFFCGHIAYCASLKLELATASWFALAYDYTPAGARGGECSSEPRRPGSGHEHIARKMLNGRSRPTTHDGHGSHSCQSADESFVGVPGGPDERLVVKARTEEVGTDAQQRSEIVLQRRPSILTAQTHSEFQAQLRSRYVAYHVAIRAQGDQCVRFLRSGREDASGSTILDAAAEEAHTLRQECGGR